MSAQDTEMLRTVGVAQPQDPAADAAVAQRWTAIAAMALVALTFLVYWPTTSSLMDKWEDTVHRTYTHGYLIVVLTLWLIWRDRARFHTAQVSLLGAAALFTLSVIWLVALRAGLQILHQALLPLLAYAAVFTCCGWHATKQIWIPLGYLYLAVPVWDAINSLLQWISVFAVQVLLRLIGIPAFFADNTFQIPAGAFEIADGCSGLHFFVVAVAVAVLYGAINRDSIGTRIKLVVFAGLLAMITNWVRIVIIVVAGHLTDMRHYLVNEEHYSFGWFVFAGTMLTYFLVVRRWPLAPDNVESRLDGPALRVTRSAFALAVVSMLPAAAFNLFDRNIAEASGNALPADVAGWDADPSLLADWQPEFEGSDAEQRLAYRSADRVIDAYAATYWVQRQGKEVVGYQNSVLGSDLVVTARLRSAQRNWIELRSKDSRGEEWVVQYAYRMDERWYMSSLDLQFAYGVRSLFSAPLTSLVALRTRCIDDCEAASRTLEQFTAVAWQ